MQTVTSLQTAHRNLSQKDKEFFKENCYVLVRLLLHDAVNQTDVVLATNNQNSMQPRNLVSNLAEQIHFATFFSEHLGWFYEAKQGAWNAFKQDHDRWRPRLNKRPNYFKAKKGFKTIDNHNLAQDWLAFLGFAYRSVNDKKEIFAREKGYYELIFLRRTRNHAHDSYKSIQDAINDSDKESPDPHMMLVAHLSRRFVDKVVPSIQASKKAALARQGIYEREDIPPAEEEKILSEDREYLLDQVLKATPLVFVDFIGYSLFRVFGDETHRLGHILLGNHSWRDLATSLDLEKVVNQAVGSDENLCDSDLLLVMWLLFREAVETIIGNAWSTSYRNARNKSRFVLNNRHQIYEEIFRMDDAIKRKVPMRVYTNGIREGEGIFGYLKRTIEEKL